MNNTHGTKQQIDSKFMEQRGATRDNCRVENHRPRHRSANNFRRSNLRTQRGDLRQFWDNKFPENSMPLLPGSQIIKNDIKTHIFHNVSNFNFSYSSYFYIFSQGHAGDHFFISIYYLLSTRSHHLMHRFGAGAKCRLRIGARCAKRPHGSLDTIAGLPMYEDGTATTEMK